MQEKGITYLFGTNLAQILSDKIIQKHPEFDKKRFTAFVKKGIEGKTLVQRVEVIADGLRECLPPDYPASIKILKNILGPENEKETGMFTHFYWLMPVSKFVEKYGLSHFNVSLDAIGEITKRNTGEYAIRPFVKQYPDRTLARMKKWAVSKNFHHRRLASEGLRPKLPWAAKLSLFIQEPEPVFEILDILKTDPVMFVKKSVANHLTDYIKVNPEAASALIRKWRRSDNEHTAWIVRHATRKTGMV